MITFEINSTTYATNNDLSGFFRRPSNSGAYTQVAGNSQVRFKNEREFQKYCRAVHKSAEFFGSKRPDVTASGNFVWRTSN